ncbi:MAG TPA: hypothetical protein VGS22_10870 [Thermoanaerobaculia bacterium]|jgi:hypothetical protein|nr:hypothetical protein [Thermoanaerobaculia bacterium]
MQRSDVSQALRAIQAREGSLNQAHCSLVELEAYHRQLLAPEEHDAVADHLALCENCSVLLLYAVIAPDHHEPNLGREEEAAEIKGAWSRFCASLESGTGSSDLEEQIDRCYAEVIALTRSPMPQTPEDRERIGRAFSRLRTLQSREAAGFRRQFESNLKMPLDAGAKIIARAGTLREKLEDLAAADVASPRADTT